MATIPKTAAKVVHVLSGGQMPMLVLPEGASQTFKRGEPVFLSAGLATEIGDNPTQILGLAAEDARNVAAAVNDVAVEVLNSDVMFEANLSDSVGTLIATAQADIGQAAGIFRDTTNSLITVYKLAATNHRVQIIAHSKKDAIGDIGGRVLCVVIPKFRQLDTTS